VAVKTRIVQRRRLLMLYCEGNRYAGAVPLDHGRRFIEMLLSGDSGH
jgi:hypothetical protein